jgi:hypothetical protein
MAITVLSLIFVLSLIVWGVTLTMNTIIFGKTLLGSRHHSVSVSVQRCENNAGVSACEQYSRINAGAHVGQCVSSFVMSASALPFVPGRPFHEMRAAPVDLCASMDPNGIDGLIPCKVTKSYDKWKTELKGDPDELYILNGISNGFRIIDSAEEMPSVYRRNYRSTTLVNKEKVEARILEEMAAGNYIVASSKPLVTSALGAVPKGLLDVRLIHDLSRPDGGVKRLANDTSVTYTTIDKATSLIVKGTFLAKIDLRSAYRSIPISPLDYKLTGIQWHFKDCLTPTSFFDCKLPFGAAKSCQIFQKLTDSIVRIMAGKGFQILGYIDDMLCIGKDKSECQLCYDTLLSLLHSLGLLINWGKCVGPSEILVYLGIEIDCVNRTLALPSAKLEDMRSLVLKWCKRKSVTKLELQQFLGKLNWAARVLRGGRTFMRRLIDLLPRAKENHHHIRITSAAKEDIDWWRYGLLQFHGHCSFKIDLPLPSFMFACDACLEGGGAHFMSDWLYASWVCDFPELSDSHINVLELFTVFLALVRWGQYLEGSHVVIRSDNTVTISALNIATSRGPELMPIIRNIFWLCVKYDIIVSGLFIPGKLNVLADHISRLHNVFSANCARFSLADFDVCKTVACKGHMSEDSYVYLQDAWMRVSRIC